MKIQKWTLALAAAGLVCPGALVQAEETLHPVLTEVSPTSISGFVDTSAVWQLGNAHTDVGRWGDGSDRQDGFNLDSIGITLAKPLGDTPWSSGYKLELLDGPDVGNKMIIHNAFVKLGAPLGNGLVLKAGVFSSLAGYEYIERYKNPNFSRSYGYYTEPGRQTGVLADYRICEGISVTAGVGNSYSSAINSRAYDYKDGMASVDESSKNAMAALTLDAPESFGPLKGAELYTAIIRGRSTTQGSITQDMLNAHPNWVGSKVGDTLQGNDLTDFTVVLTLPTPLKKLTAVVTYDYTSQDGSGNEPGLGGNHADATALYLIYKATDKLTFANRLDYANGTAGYFGTMNPGASSDKLLAETFTASYALWANVITRAELRWDRDLSGASFGNAPSNGQKDAISVAMNVIYVF